MWEAQERYTQAQDFFTPLFAHLASETRLRTLSNESVTNILRSIGTLSYMDESVEIFMGEARRRALISGDIQLIQTLMTSASNIKALTKDRFDQELANKFSEEFYKVAEK